MCVVVVVLAVVVVAVVVVAIVALVVAVHVVVAGRRICSSRAVMCYDRVVVVCH